MKATDLMHMEDDGILMYELYWLICTFCKKRKWAGFNLKVQYLFYIPYYTLYTHFTPTILTIGDQPSDAESRPGSASSGGGPRRLGRGLSSRLVSCWPCCGADRRSQGEPP